MGCHTGRLPAGNACAAVSFAPNYQDEAPMSVRIVTDSTCDLPAEILTRYGIFVVP